MSLAHPSQSCIVVDFNGIAPKICQNFLHNAVELACSKGLPFFNQCIHLTLEGGFQEVGDKVMEVGVCQAMSQSEAFLTWVIRLVLQVITE
ncbi:Uncharacterised protein [Streptococcus pneumoniae]|nr:Uncharacterised protein [Streptococcus pneumoniae]